MSEPRHPDATARGAEELLAERAWLARFAAALAGAEGEDLVQDAWVRALARPVSALERPRAWLASALRNAARSRARSETRRAARERDAARPEAEPSTAELAARAELEQLAVRAVLDLAEPYRAALLLRYLRGLEPAEIAERLGVPASTVRNRVARGLELVRARLDAGHGRREAWLALVLPLERWAWPSLVGGGVATVAVTSGGLMGAKWIAGGAVAVVAAALWWTARDRGQLRVASQGAHAPVVLADAPEGAPDEPDVAAPAPLDSLAVRESVADAPSASAADSTELAVRVTWGRDGSVAARHPVTVMPWDGDPFPVELAGITDDSGTARFEGLAAGSYLIEEGRTAGESVDVFEGESVSVELVIPAGVNVDCRVVDLEGVAVPGAEVWFSDYGNRSDGRVLGRTDARGRLELRDLPYAGHSLAARAAGHAPSAQVDLTGSAGSRVEVELRLRGAGASLAGVVQDERGAPVAGAEVLLGVEFPARVTLADGATANGPPALSLMADEHGRFLARGLQPGALLVQARRLGYGPALLELTLAPGDTASCVVTLGDEFVVRGVARDGEGRPLADVSITGGARYFDFGGRQTSTRADGSYELRGLGRGTVLLGANSEALGSAKTELELGPGIDAHWDPVLAAGAEIAGWVRDERGEPLEGWQVAPTAPDQTGMWMREARTDETGHFRLVNCPPQRFVLAVRAPSEALGAPCAIVEDFVRGQQDLVVVIPDDAHPSAFLVGRVRAADGSELALPSLVYFPPAMGYGLRAQLDADGTFRIGPLRPGEYALAASARDLGELRLNGLGLEPGETEDVGEIVLERAGHILVRVRASAGVLPERMHTEIVRERERAGQIRYDGLEGRSGPLGRGRYALRTTASDWRAPEHEVDVLPGETSEVELVLEPATGRVLEFRVPTGDRARNLAVLVKNERGETVEDYDGADREGDRFVLGLGGFVVGTYSVEARTDSGRVVAGSFVVLDLAPTDQPIVFELR